VAFCRSHYTVRGRGAVAAALRACPDLDLGHDGQSFVWKMAVSEEETRLLGNLRLEKDGLVLECMSEERLRRGRALIEAVAGFWLTHRADTTQDPWQAVGDRVASDRKRQVLSSGLPPEQEGELLRQVYDRHYRTWPDEPLFALGRRSAREAVKSAQGREEVANLLASMESLEARKPPAQRYDFGWIWTELGIEDLR